MPLAASALNRLTARPQSGVHPALAPGVRPLESGEARDGLLSVPAGYDPERPAPLLVLLHGAGGSAERILARFDGLPDEFGMLVLVPESRAPTWDVVVGGFGPDVAFIDAALNQVFATCAVDPARIAIGGFSDGASYGLSLGLANGDLFSHILAFSPGFLAPSKPHGEPRLFISHGTQDRVLPIDMCGGILAPMLKNAGYDLVYRVFDGDHTVPEVTARAAFRWFTEPAA